MVPWISLLGLLALASFARACVDEKGRPVDYFLIYKIPKLENSPNQLVRSGYGYAYLSGSTANKWQLSNRSVADGQSMLGATLKSVYQGSGTVFPYNDQRPKHDNSSSGGAHAKGLFVSSNQSTFWLAHSVPRFPDLTLSSYSYPESGRENGQILICISLARKDDSSIVAIGQHLLLIKASLYSTRYTQDFLTKYTVFQDLINKKRTKNQTLISTIYSTKRVKFTIFAKSNKYIKDIYSQLIAPFVKEDLRVQTWRNGAGEKLDSDCQDQYKIMNIDQIKIDSGIDWKYTEDHAKWAVSVKSAADKPTTICVSDLNRMRSQFKRGGGSICFQSPSLWSIFDDTAEDVEACPRGKARGSNSTRVAR